MTLQFKRSYFDYLRNTASCVDLSSSAPFLKHECECAYLYPKDNNKYVIKKTFFPFRITILKNFQILIQDSYNIRDYFICLYDWLFDIVRLRTLRPKVQTLFANFNI